MAFSGLARTLLFKLGMASHQFGELLGLLRIVTDGIFGTHCSVLHPLPEIVLKLEIHTEQDGVQLNRARTLVSLVPCYSHTVG